MTLPPKLRRLLRKALGGRLLAVSFGSGVDSTAMLVALKLAGLRPAIITFADLVAEKPETMVHLDRMNAVLAQWGWPEIIVCRKIPLASAAHHPDLLERALFLERNALTGRHSRFDAVEFGASWEEMVQNADRFPSSTTTVGLGRSFAWNQWARVKDVVDDAFHVKRGSADRARFLDMADQLRSTDNALDARSAA